MIETPEYHDEIFETAERLTLEATVEPDLVPAYTTAMKTARRLEGFRQFTGKKKMTQLDKILDHMRKNGSITQREAMLDHHIQSFTRRIADLRALGYDIISENRKHPVTGQEYTRYYLNDNAGVAA